MHACAINCRLFAFALPIHHEITERTFLNQTKLVVK